MLKLIIEKKEEVSSAVTEHYFVTATGFGIRCCTGEEGRAGDGVCKVKNRPRLENGEMKMKSRCIRPSEEREKRKETRGARLEREREIKGTSEFKCTAHSNSVCLAAADTSRGLLTTTRWGLT